MTMSSRFSEYETFFAHLRSLKYHFSEKWVVECVNYYKSVNPNISLETLKNEIKQQWLLVNLREIKVPCLPPDLKSKHKTILNGTYAVQVESMMDCSTSCYSQFQKLIRASIENIEATKEKSEWNNKTDRCLTFWICDGVQEIRAMEYQPIKKIRTNDPELLPGFKMLIIGPVECRKGMILLKEENVQVCGGEVDIMIATNNLKSLLIKRLELDVDDYPENASTGSAEETKNLQLSHTETQNNLDENCVKSLLSENDDLFLSLPLETDIFAQEMKPKDSENPIMEENDFFDRNVSEWEEISTIEFPENMRNKKHNLPQGEMQTSQEKRILLEASSSREFLYDSLGPVSNSVHEDEFEEDMFIECEIKPGTNPVTSKKQTKIHSFFKSGDSSVSTVSRTSTISKKPVLISDKPFVYLKQILSEQFNKICVFKIKAIILTLKKKITIENDKFNLRANITDGSACVDVDFSSEVLEDLLGFSPCEMIEMLKLKQTNTAIAQRVKESFLKAQQKLISLNCLMELKLLGTGKNPLILSLEEITMEHLRALKDRRLNTV